MPEFIEGAMARTRRWTGDAGRRRAVDSGAGGRGRARGQGRGHFLAVAVELLHAGEAAFQQQAQVVQDAFDHLALPRRVEADLLVQPALQPLRVGQAALHGIAWEQPCIDVQVGRVQRLRGAARAGHQHADLGEGRPGLVAELLDHMGVDVIEAGFAMASNGDFESVKAIAKKTKKAPVTIALMKKHSKYYSVKLGLSTQKNYYQTQVCSPMIQVCMIRSISI